MGEKKILRALKQLFSTGDDFPIPGDTWQHMETLLIAMTGKGWGWGSLLLASSGYRPEMLLSILQCPEQKPPHSHPEHRMIHSGLIC